MKIPKKSLKSRSTQKLFFTVLILINLTNTTHARILFVDDVFENDSEMYEIGTDDDASVTPLTLQFGGINSESITWDTSQFNVSDDLNVNGGVTVSNTLDANGIVNLGDNGDVVSIDSSSWDISATGIANGLTGITSSGSIDFSSASNIQLSFTDDNQFTLDNDEVGNPDQDVNIIANQGSESDGILRYDDGDNRWKISNNGGSFENIPLVLNDLTDTSVASPSGGDVLTYNSGSNQWESASTTIGSDEIFHAYDIVGNRTIPTSFTAVNFDTVGRADSIYSFTPGGDAITITQTGTYDVSFECTADVNDTDRSKVDWRMTLNGSEVAGSRAATYHRTVGDGRTTGSIRRILSITSGNTIQFQGLSDDPTQVETEPNGCRTTIIRLDNYAGLQGPKGDQGDPGTADGWVEAGSLVSTTLNTQIDGDLNSECGHTQAYWAERGTIASNASWAMGNGQTPFGSPMGCNGRVKRFAAVCTGAIGTSLSAIIRLNNVATACTVNLSTTVGEVTSTSCNIPFSANDVVGVYAGTEVGTWTECVGTFWVQYD